MRYSREEELSLLSGTKMRTDQLNSFLIMEPWERMTLVETDVKFKVNMKINHTFAAMASDGGLVEEFFYAFADIAQSHLDMDLDDKLVDNVDSVAGFKNHVILFGYHRLGSHIFDSLKKISKKIVVVDLDPEVVEGLPAKGISCVYGDAYDVELFDKLNIDKAKMVVITFPANKRNSFCKREII